MKQIRWMDPRGFTLIELLLVLAIIGILAGIAVPVLLGQREKAKVTAARTNAAAVEVEIAHQTSFDLPPDQVIANILASNAFKYPNTKNPFGGEANILVRGVASRPGEVGIEYVAGGGVKPDGTPGDVYRLTWQTREGGAPRNYVKEIPAS